MSQVTAKLQFIPGHQTGGPPTDFDLRLPAAGGQPSPQVEVEIQDARKHKDLGLHTSGFDLIHAPSTVVDFYDHEHVMEIYYEECKSLARRLTGAHTAYTFDHIIREPDGQLSAGGTDGSQQRSGREAGGGYINSVHMDYTDRTTWDRYLALHGQVVPDAERVFALNFWRPISASVDDNPLAVCDARTVSASELQEVNVFGYGASNYSWYDIGIETFSVAASDDHRWYYYPGMTPDEVLIIKSYDSAGVIGTTCPHGSFAHPEPNGVARRSIELRVLCFC
jgi:hypothetical protein